MILFCLTSPKQKKKIAEKDPAIQTNFLLVSKAYLLLDVIKLEESFDFAIIPLFLFKHIFQTANIFSLKYRYKLTWYHVLFFYLLKLEFYDLNVLQSLKKECYFMLFSMGKQLCGNYLLDCRRVLLK